MAKRQTKRALITSVISLLVCFSMLVGTTFAWFTDSVTSSGNIIKSGTLEVKLYWADGKEAPASATWNNVETAETNKILNYTNWEPGYTEARHVKIANEGSLALKYQLKIVPQGDVGILADVIDVYYSTAGTAVADRDTTGMTKLGTLSEVIAGKLTTVVSGDLAKETDKVYTFVFKMQESAGNDYQNLTVGATGFDFVLLATQQAEESDSFGPDYDEDAWVDGMQVYTPQDLQAAIDNGEEYIDVMQDMELDSPIVIPGAASSSVSAVSAYSGAKTFDGIVINLNGRTLKNDNGYVIESEGDFLLTGNGTLKGLGCIRSKGGSAIIENGNFYATSRWQDGMYQHTLKAENADVVINGGNFDATVGGHTNAVMNASSNATITINGGSFKNVSGELAQFDPYLLTYEKNGKVVINDGTFYGGWRFNGETATTDIYGGNFTVGFDGQSFNASSTHKLTVYGGSFAPNVNYPNHSPAGKVSGLVADNYVSSEDNGIVTVTGRPGEGKVSYRPYIMNDSRKAIQIDMQEIFAWESLQVELWHGDTLLTTTTYAGKYPYNNPGYTTCCVAMPGSAFFSWDTEYAEGVTLTSLNVPDAIKVYADGVLTDTFTHSSGTVFADKINDYLALDCVTKIDQLTPENYSTVAIESNKQYALAGDFGGKNVALTMAVGVENVIFDGSYATNINELIIIQNGSIINNAATPLGERSGNVTVQNFSVLSQINVFACKTEVVVQENTAEALMIYAGNCDVKVLNNIIDANFESHPTYQNETATWNTNNYGIALNIFDYNLWLDGNTVTDATGHAIGINGWETTIDNGDANVIESFKGNTITVNSTSNTKRAAFKVWDDETYASNDAPTDVVNATAQAFIDATLADGSNTFNIIDGYDHTIFCFYNVNTND